MDPAPDALPDDVAALKAALIAERAKCLEVAAELAVARAKASEDMALIAAQKLRIAKLERQIYGQRSERSERLIEQLSLTFEELAANATEDELAAEQAVAKATNVRAFTRRGAERDTFPDHLPRERVVMDPPTACECCGGTRLRFRSRRPSRCRHVQPRRHLQDEWRRPAGMVGRRPLAHRRTSGSPARRVVALELAACRSARVGSRGLTMHVNKVSHVKTVDRVAKELGEDVDWLHEVALEMDVEDGVIWVYGLENDGVLAFTDFGVETLVELIKTRKESR